MELKFDLYESWMRNQVISLMCQQYGYNEDEYENFFKHFYESPFQEKAVAVVAIDEKKVVGFQSFFYWPYKTGIKIVESYQSGSSIIHPDYRGKGLFKKLLKFAQENNKSKNIDLFIGFPVEASFGSFIKDNWENPFNLRWYVKLNSIFSLLFSYNEEKARSVFTDEKIVDLDPKHKQTTISIDRKFVTWRKLFQKDKILYLSFKQEGKVVQFGLKINIRKRVIKELIIGEVYYNELDVDFFNAALKHCLKEIGKLRFITIVSIAINPNIEFIKQILLTNGFRKTSKEIYFIFKALNADKEMLDFSKIEMYRGDIDTW
ncbi:MAG: GNAT family N-acetyltransferase [Flavobacteriales bacterium]|nr:GNAT family N-acetyltransferase [Flavobacteriales bacterium]